MVEWEEDAPNIMIHEWVDDDEMMREEKNLIERRAPNCNGWRSSSDYYYSMGTAQGAVEEMKEKAKEDRTMKCNLMRFCTRRRRSAASRSLSMSYTIVFNFHSRCRNSSIGLGLCSSTRHFHFRFSLLVEEAIE